MATPYGMWYGITIRIEYVNPKHNVHRKIHHIVSEKHDIRLEKFFCYDVLFDFECIFSQFRFL